MQNLSNLWRYCKKTLLVIYYFLDTWLLRFVGPFATFFTMILAFSLDFDVTKLKDAYPNWGGAIDLLESVNFYKLLVIFAVISALGAVYNVVRQGRIRKLRIELKEVRAESGAIAENIHGLFEAVLRALANELSLSEDGAERVSIYVHRKQHSSFVPCGRFSHNPVLAQKGRSSFPDNQGCISRAWEEGWHFSKDVPLDTDGREYRDFMLNTYDIGRNATRSMKMKAVEFAAKRIKFGAIPIGVIVVEANESGKLNEDFLKEKLGTVSDDYGSMIAAVNRYIPDPQKAKELGL